MPNVAVRTVKVSELASHENPYALLVAAIVSRALGDARGEATPRMAHHNPRVLQQEALAWLEEAQGLTELLELAGFDAEPVVRAIQQCLAEEAEHDSAITAFGKDYLHP